MTTGNYDTVEDFAEDVRLVFRNTRTYNAPGSDIVVMAGVLESMFETRFAAIKSMVGDDEYERK